ncbi:MAG: hypothetical protein R6W78_08815 [Bacteroidales bacterium]
MKQVQIILFFLLLFFSSCVQTNTDKQFENFDTLKTNKDSIEDIENRPIMLDTSPRPTNDFINFTHYLDSIGYISDTNRAKIVSYRVLGKVKIDFFSGRPFYRLSKKNPDIFFTENWFETQPFKDSTVNYRIFENFENAFGYYYRQNIKSNLIEDGVIEEWQFLTEVEAKEALVQINKIKHMVYFNTASFTLQHDSILYIFHTRASAFDLTLKKIHEEFEKSKKTEK